MVETAAATANTNGVREARRSPAAHLAGIFEAASLEGIVEIREIPFQTMAGIRVRRDSDEGRRVASVTGGLPAACGEVVERDGVATLWLGPAEFLVVAPENAHESLGGDLVPALVEALGDGQGQVVDLSANRTVFELSGVRARDVLEKGCSLDLHPRVLKAGTALSTEIGHIPVILWKSGEDTFKVLPRASFTDFLGRWLVDGMREFASPEVP
ncbi:sarcosine oxidase subunit gamma [Arthrobacter sp. SW1]|uniref:sarcosine oxidase subunit gamma n=1 Tax=Arthrobacter sp. SW1 TaxID=1920889 RepID=UPI000877CBDA|nr:sarcosine oxidase subunit gamma family protein [Arthrobacter sp. SW1]OFI37603.1 sarcosine oxidase subunit gamma [Arthrobacter sp. SW1]